MDFAAGVYFVGCFIEWSDLCNGFFFATAMKTREKAYGFDDACSVTPGYFFFFAIFESLMGG